jgi:hypothetical protein
VSKSVVLKEAGGFNLKLYGIDRVLTVLFTPIMAMANTSTLKYKKGKRCRGDRDSFLEVEGCFHHSAQDLASIIWNWWHFCV